MPVVSMTGMLQAAKKGGYAVGAFNIVNELTAAAAVAAAEENQAPVILQTSVSTVKQLGAARLAGFLKSLAKNATVPVAIHLDHCTDIALAKQCADLGWSSLMVDASHLPLEENIAATRQVAEYVQGRDISVEGELGAIGGVEDNIVVDEADARLAGVQDSITFTKGTGVHAFAPAIGTAHGLYKGEPKLDFTRFTEIGAAVEQPLVVHGGTGLAHDVFRHLVELGAAKINISTAVKQAYLGGTAAFLAKEPGCGNPLKLDAYVYNEVKELAAGFIRLFGGVNKG